MKEEPAMAGSLFPVTVAMERLVDTALCLITSSLIFEYTLHDSSTSKSIAL